MIIKHQFLSVFINNFYRTGDISRITTGYNAFTERIIELGLQGDVDSKTILSVSAFLHLLPYR
jgi:hypothetical protein